MPSIRQTATSFFSIAILIAVLGDTSRAQENSASSTAQEAELLSVLRSDAPASQKAITCKKLAIHGSDAAVPELARLLPDPQLSSWARIGLEAIPGSAADLALRNAADSLDGKLLIGVINSIGVRRDAGAVELLSRRMQDGDVEVASAAAVALGRIGNDQATKVLRGALATGDLQLRSAVAEGCVLCAERFHSEGNSSLATEIYDQVRMADVPSQRILEATRGAILSRKEAGIPLLMEQLRSPDKNLFQLAVGTAREMPGNGIDQALADELELATPERGALIIQAMSDRPESVVLPAIAKAASQGDKETRLSALEALGRIGNDSCLSTLMETAMEKDGELSLAAKTALAEIPGQQIDEQILARLNKASGENSLLLVEIVGKRRIEATDVLLKAVKSPDKALRGAALTALGETVAFGDLDVLISQVVAPGHPEDSALAAQALKTASVRMPDRESCASELAAAVEKAPSSARIALLEILGEVGGAKALSTIGAAANSNDPELQDVGSRLLGKWNSVEAAPVLFDLAKSSPEKKYQIRALRGAIGIVRKFEMPESQRVEMCRKAFELASRFEEQKLVLEVLKLYPCTDGLKLAIDAIEIPGLKLDGTEATLAIAQKLGDHGMNIAELLANVGFEKVKLEIIKAEYGAGTTQQDVTGVLRKQAQDSPLILLPTPGYNACFGGDPVPGVAKQLRIQYRFNGREGESLFAENSPIILPQPK